MLTIACKCIRGLGRAERIIKILTAIRLTVFAAAIIYAVVTAASIIKQNCCE